MESDGLEGFDFSQPLHYALSQLHNGQNKEDEDQFGNSFPKPASLSAMAEAEDSDNPPTTMEIIAELIESQDDYPKTVKIMMQRGLLKKRQPCKKCERFMNLRRRKTLYEWRCRTKDKKGDCSSCSIKSGSWFEHTKFPFKTMLNYLLMHCKGYSTSHMAHELSLTSHTITDIRRFVYQITDRIVKRYPEIGRKDQVVHIEVIKIRTKSAFMDDYLVAAGRELRSNRCFAVILPDTSIASFERIRNKHVVPGSIIKYIKTVFEENTSLPDAVYFDEVGYYKNPNDRFFTELRKDPPEHIFTNQVLESWLNDHVVRLMEGDSLLERCIEELIAYTQ